MHAQQLSHHSNLRSLPGTQRPDERGEGTNVTTKNCHLDDVSSLSAMFGELSYLIEDPHIEDDDEF